MKSPFVLALFSVALGFTLAAAPVFADPQAVILFPTHGSLFVTITRPSLDVEWTANTGSGPALDHYAGKLVSQAEIQQALGLGSAPPSPLNLQEYFGSQAPGFVGWATYPATQTSVHFDNVTPGQVWFFALTVIDEAGGYDGVFDTNRNVLRFKPSTENLGPMVRITSPLPSSVTTIQVPAAFDIQWVLMFPMPPGQFLDHYAAQIVPESDIQAALGLGTAHPTQSDVQTYFGAQGPALAGWSVHPNSDTGMHVSVPPDGRIYFLAVTAVGEIGEYDVTFDLTRNVLRFMPNGPVPTVELTWGALKASRR